jgi:hypothetical protein
MGTTLLTTQLHCGILAFSATFVFELHILQSSCLHPASVVSKTLFIIPTDAHYYKSVEMLK